MEDHPWTDIERFGTARPEAIEIDPVLERLIKDAQFRDRAESAEANRSVNPSAQYDDIKDEYSRLLSEAEIRPEHLGSPSEKWSVLWHATTVEKNRVRYEEIASPTNVPWYAIGILHALECSFDFSRHLFNGDPLDDYTVRYPPGYPKDLGEPPFSFNESAIAALEYDKFANQTDWSTPRTLFRIEQYNGMSYRTKLRMASPYLWSYTSLYKKGKFKEIPKPGGGYKSVYDPDLVSKQCGAAAILKALVNSGAVDTNFG